MSLTPRPQRTSSTAIDRSSPFSVPPSPLSQSREQSVEDIDNQMRRIVLNHGDDTIMLG